MRQITCNGVFRPVFSSVIALSILGGSFLLGISPVALAARKYLPPEQQPAEVIPKKQESDVITAPEVVIKTVLVPVQAKRKPVDPFVNLMDEQRFYEALRVVEQRIKYDPKNPYLQLTRAQILRMDGEYQLAEQAYQELFPTIKSKTVLSKAYYGLGMLRFAQAEQFARLNDNTTQKALLDEANSLLSQSIVQVSSVDSWAALANIALLENRLDDCDYALSKANGLNPNHLSVLLTRGYLALAESKPQQALQIGYNIRKRSPNDLRSLMLLGRAAFANGLYDDAIIHFRQLTERLPLGNTEALRWLSQSYEKKDRFDEAQATLEKAVFINPFDWEAVQSLMALYEREDDTQRSMLLIRTLLSQVSNKEQKEITTYSYYRLTLEQALLARLNHTQQWPEAYAKAKKLIESCQLPQVSMLNPEPVKPVNFVSIDVQQQSFEAFCQTGQDSRNVLFAEAAYFSGEGLIYRHSFLGSPIVKSVLQQLSASLAKRPEQWDLRLALLQLNPLVPLPLLPADYKPGAISNGFFTLAEQERLLWLKASFVAGDKDAYQKAYASLIDTTPVSKGQRAFDLDAAEEKIDIKNKLHIANELLELGDLQGTGRILDQLAKDPLTKPSENLNAEKISFQRELNQAANKLLAKTKDTQSRVQMLQSIQIKDNASLWARIATNGLLASPYNLTLRQIVSDSLLKQRLLDSALQHQQIGRLYAPAGRQQRYWLGKISKTQSAQRRITKN